MLAVDTNVVVRYLARDDARQTAQADELFRSQQILILKTVILETEWVLRYSYGFDRGLIGAALRGDAGLPNVSIEDAAAVSYALDWFADGMGFADALHVASAAGADHFVTFDRKLSTLTRRPPVVKVLLLH